LGGWYCLIILTTLSSEGTIARWCFSQESDFEVNLSNLRELKGECGIQVDAYCLMTNHVHLLQLGEAIAELGRLMKALSARMTRYCNRLEKRSGTLWESR